MNKLFILAIVVTFSSLLLHAESNKTESNRGIENNSTVSKSEKISQELAKQMEREKKFAKEQRFYQAEEYDLSSYEVDRLSLDSIPLIEPDYDFDMDDVYD
jgi:hypothetical protein